MENLSVEREKSAKLLEKDGGNVVINAVAVGVNIVGGESPLVEKVEEVWVPGVGFEEGEELSEEGADEEVELVEAEGVDAGPLAAHGEEEGGEVLKGEGAVEGEEEGGEAVDKVVLGEGLVGVPHAVEEALPELLGVVLGERLRLQGEPRFEDEAEGFLACGLVAAC